jgi:MFS family permease
MKPIHYLTAFNFLNHSAFAGGRVLVALYAVFLGASPTMVGLLVGLFAAVPMVGSVPLGRMADRHRARKPLILYITLSSTGLLICALWQDTAALMVTGAVVGASYIALNIICTALAGRHGDSAQRPINFTWLGLGTSAANTLGPLSAGFAIDHLGFRAAALIMTALPLISLPLVLLGRLPGQDTLPAQPKAGTKRGRPTELLFHPGMFPVYLMGVYFMLAWDIFLVMTPVYGKSLGISASSIGIIIATYSAAVFVMRLFAGPVARAFTPWQAMLLSLALTALVCIIYGLVSQVWLLIVCAFLMGACQSFAAPMAQTALFENSPRERYSEAMGLRMSLGMAAQFILPLIAGVLASIVGVQAIFWIVGVAMLAGGWVYRGRWGQKTRV